MIETGLFRARLNSKRLTPVAEGLAVVIPSLKSDILSCTELCDIMQWHAPSSTR